MDQTDEIDAMSPIDAIGQQRMSNITPDPRDDPRDGVRPYGMLENESFLVRGAL